jgi:hypothetical protein
MEVGKNAGRTNACLRHRCHSRLEVRCEADGAVRRIADQGGSPLYCVYILL